MSDIEQLIREWRDAYIPKDFGLAEELANALLAERKSSPWISVEELVDAQAEDEELWFITESAAEAYLQQELRKLHAAIDSCRYRGGKR